MHSMALVVVPAGTPPEEIEEVVAERMAPWSEETNDDGHWDWWQLGGRFTGQLDGYKPHQDPRNWETCSLCLGTPGKRSDDLGRQFRQSNPDYGCNGCHGGPEPGVRVVWPTGWAKHPGDVMPALDYLTRLDSDPDTRVPFAVVTDKWSARERWNGKDWVDTPNWRSVARSEIASALTDPDDLVVVVDYHF